MSYYYKYIVSVKPGVTGYWQITGRNDVTFETRIHMDMDYYRNNNLFIDAKILGKTVGKMLLKEGAR